MQAHGSRSSITQRSSANRQGSSILAAVSPLQNARIGGRRGRQGGRSSEKSRLTWGTEISIACWSALFPDLHDARLRTESRAHGGVPISSAFPLESESTIKFINMSQLKRFCLLRYLDLTKILG
jgi:hypothetical protein